MLALTPHLALLFIVGVFHAQDRPVGLGILLNLHKGVYLELELPCYSQQVSDPSPALRSLTLQETHREGR